MGLIDSWGVGKMFALTLITGVLLPVPLFFWWTHVASDFSVPALMIGQTLLGLQGSLTCSVYLWIVELFPVKVRSTGVSLAYNFGIGIFDGAGLQQVAGPSRHDATDPHPCVTILIVPE